MFKRIGIIAKPDDPEVRKVLTILIPYLRQRDLDVTVDTSCASLLEGTELDISPLTAGNNRDLIISVGGDGTLLHAAHMLSAYDVRLLGINMGRLGFLTDIAPDEMIDKLDDVLDGNYLEEKRFILSSRSIRDDRVMQEQDAINDVVIQKWNFARLIGFDTYINGIYVNSQRSDGLIVSTPTGSTAYALSGGGPILHPSLDAIALVPICPHTLSNRPIVVDGNSLIEIVVGTREKDHARLTCDGEVAAELAPGDRIQVEKSGRYIRLIHPAEHDHFSTLRAKLQWG